MFIVSSAQSPNDEGCNAAAWEQESGGLLDVPQGGDPTRVPAWSACVPSDPDHIQEQHEHERTLNLKVN